MKHWFYVVFPYVIPVFAFIFGVLLTVIVALLQLCISNMENTEEAPSKEFFKVHLKGAKFMFGNAVHFRKRDGAVQLHGFSFESTLAFLYILMCECVLAGTTALLTVSILTSRNTLPCYWYSANNQLDCFLGNETSTWQGKQHDCTALLESTDATKLVCYEIVYNIGAALGLVGGLLIVLPRIFSFLTKFIIEYAVAEIHFKGLLIVLQVLLYFSCIGYVVIGFTTDFVKSDSFIDLVGILVLLLCIFCLPWCCMGMDKSSYHHDGDREAELDDSYEAIQEREPIINVERHQRNINRNGNPNRNSRPGQQRRPDPFDSRRPRPRY